jgi:outer membrane protein OmpA-like peptidoglycan-associated protein
MRFIILLAASLAAIVGSPLTVCSQHYYVVIGSFAGEEKTSEFEGYLSNQVIDTTFTVSDQQNLFNVYVLENADKDAGTSKTLQVKDKLEFLTAGVNAEVEGRASEAPLADISTASASASGGASSGAVIPPKPAGKYFKFIIESPEGTPVKETVHLVDFEKQRELAAYNSHTFVDLLRPGRRNEPMAVVCSIFGYKEIHKYIDYSDPSLTDVEAYIDSDGAWVIPYKLERLEKGDVSIMHNVSFYKDAAVMRKSSSVDLDELVKMMHSNPYYEITIHAHCNGKSRREILTPGPDKNYFDVSGADRVNGSAKHLTALRAETIRTYLADHGVDATRVEIFPWGGSDMMVKTDGPHTFMNDRIEIEITRD